MYDLQRADLWKRISALLFDFIMLMIVVVGAALLLSAVLQFDAYSARLESVQEQYESEYGVAFHVSADEYNALTEEERTQYNDAYDAFSKDAQAVELYGILINFTLLITTFCILIAHLLLEFLVPLLLGNGQTIGKKIFGIGVMREDGVRLSPMLLFARTVLGKYTVETMIPVMIVIMFFLNTIGIVGVLILLALVIVQIVLIASNRARTPIHDKLAHTVTVDISSQKIFDSPEELLAYKQQLHAQKVQSTDR